MTDDLIGQRYDVKVERPDQYFVRDFRIVGQTEKLLWVRTKYETYWITKTRFESALENGIIARSTKE